MLTWTAFEALAKVAKSTNDPKLHQFYVSRSCELQYDDDEHVRFVLSFIRTLEGEPYWSCKDRTPANIQEEYTTGTMRECVQWMAGRLLFGA